MTSRTRWTLLLVPALLALSACSTPVGAGSSPTAGGGSVELAVSESCVEGSDPQCVVVNGEGVMLPAEFERAGVESADVAQGGEVNAVNITFDDEGAAIFQKLTEQAAGAGSNARLVVKIGNEIQSAPRVMQTMTGKNVQISLGPDGSPQKILEMIQSE